MEWDSDGSDRRRKTAQSEAGVPALPEQDGALASTVNIGTPVGQDVTTTKYTNHSKVAWYQCKFSFFLEEYGNLFELIKH